MACGMADKANSAAVLIRNGSSCVAGVGLAPTSAAKAAKPDHTMKIDEILRQTREYQEQANREREERGLPTKFFPPAPYNFADLKTQAEMLGRKEGPNLLTPKQTDDVRKWRDGINPERFPEKIKWIDDYLRRFGAV